jgi:hypothetical protein
LALFQGLGIAVALESQQGLVLDPGLMFRFVTVSTLVTGTMFLMWLGEQITERGWVTASRSSSLRVLLLVCRIRSVVVRACSHRCHASLHGARDLRAGGGCDGCGGVR